jgi:hypothetical protein
LHRKAPASLIAGNSFPAADKRRSTQINIVFQSVFISVHLRLTLFPQPVRSTPHRLASPTPQARGAARWTRYFSEGYDAWGLNDKDHPVWHAQQDEWLERYRRIGLRGFLTLGEFLRPLMMDSERVVQQGRTVRRASSSSTPPRRCPPPRVPASGESRAPELSLRLKVSDIRPPVPAGAASARYPGARSKLRSFHRQAGRLAGCARWYWLPEPLERLAGSLAFAPDGPDGATGIRISARSFGTGSGSRGRIACL